MNRTWMQVLVRAVAVSLMYMSAETAVKAHDTSCPLWPGGPRGCCTSGDPVPADTCSGYDRCFCPPHPGTSDLHCFIGREVGYCGWTEQMQCGYQNWNWYPSGVCCSPSDDACNCNETAGMMWDDNLMQCVPDPCPVLIDLQNNGANYQLTSPEDGVPFDLTATGQQSVVSWTRADSSVAFVVLDRNGNGQIDDGSELFGNATVKSDGTRAQHGFEALADIDANRDGKLDSSDPIYGSLRLWLDRNHNGISEASELLRLGDAGLTTVFTAFTERRRVDRHGNEYRYEGSSLLRQGNEEVRRRVFDVFPETIR